MKFSIIIPVYNVAPFIGQCIDSVIVAARGLDVEVICIDDGSVDGGGEILDEYASQMCEKNMLQMIVCHQQNLGVSAARNRGLELASSDYVWFVDGDDVVAPDSLRTLGKIIVDRGFPDIVQFCLTNFTSYSQVMFTDANGVIKEYDLEDIDLRRQAYRAHALWLLGSSAVYRRSFVASERFEVFSNAEDSLWGRRAFYRAKTLVHVDKALYGYRQRPDSANNVWTKRRWNCYCKVNWLMVKEGLAVKGLFWDVLFDGLKAIKYACAYRKRISDEVDNKNFTKSVSA